MNREHPISLSIFLSIQSMVIVALSLLMETRSTRAMFCSIDVADRDASISLSAHSRPPIHVDSVLWLWQCWWNRRRFLFVFFASQKWRESIELQPAGQVALPKVQIFTAIQPGKRYFARALTEYIHNWKSGKWCRSPRALCVARKYLFFCAQCVLCMKRALRMTRRRSFIFDELCCVDVDVRAAAEAVFSVLYVLCQTHSHSVRDLWLQYLNALCLQWTRFNSQTDRRMSWQTKNVRELVRARPRSRSSSLTLAHTNTAQRTTVTQNKCARVRPRTRLYMRHFSVALRTSEICHVWTIKCDARASWTPFERTCIRASVTGLDLPAGEQTSMCSTVSKLYFATLTRNLSEYKYKCGNLIWRSN